MILPATASKEHVFFSNLVNEMWIDSQLVIKALEDILLREEPELYSRKVRIKTSGPNGFEEEFDMVDFKQDPLDSSNNFETSLDPEFTAIGTSYFNLPSISR